MMTSAVPYLGCLNDMSATVDGDKITIRTREGYLIGEYVLSWGAKRLGNEIADTLTKVHRAGYDDAMTDIRKYFTINPVTKKRHGKG